MIKRYCFSFFAASMLLGACKNGPSSGQVAASKDTMTTKDLHTQSNADSITLQHVALDINVDFDKKQISGSATWSIDNNHKQKELRLDTYDLTIDSVLVDGKKTTHVL